MAVALRAEGLPPLTIQMNRADPFDQFDGCGNGRVACVADGLVDKIYNLWDRNPVTRQAQLPGVERQLSDKPAAPTRLRATRRGA